MSKVNKQQFSDLFQSKLGTAWGRALTIFENYGPHLGYDVTNVLLHAVDQEKVAEVLNILDEHYQSHLKYQHPKIRGTVCDNFLGVNATQVMFVRLCTQTLGLQAANSV